LAAQASRQQRFKIADDILDNSGSPLLARAAVALLHKKYTQLSAQALLE
jgi:dephospho-CoA kinase